MIKKSQLPEAVIEQCRALRLQETEAERLLRGLLRYRGLAGLKFRRQHPCKGYYLDFYCYEARLAVELDGGQHLEGQQAQYDEERTKALEKEGIKVLRFWNGEVSGHLEEVLSAIWEEAQERLKREA